MSVWVSLDMTVAEGGYEAVEPFLEAKLPAVRGFDGALSVTVHYERPTQKLLILEEWKSRDHHAAYIDSIMKNGVMSELVAFMTGPPNVAYLQRMPI